MGFSHAYGAPTERKEAVSMIRKAYYFAVWNALSFVYKDRDIAPYQVAYLGEFPEEMSKFLKTAGSRINIRMEVSV